MPVKKSKSMSPKRIASKQVSGSSKIKYRPASPKRTASPKRAASPKRVKTSYPPGFDICGYAKEIYDANKGQKSFKDKHFHTAMTYYSFVFCYEKELRVLHNDKSKMTWKHESFEGVEKALHKIFKKCEKLLVKANTVEIGKNKEIAKIHTKNIVELLVE